MSTPSMSKMTATASSPRPFPRAAGEGSGAIGHELEEISVGIAEVHGGAIDATGAATFYRTDLYGHPVGGQTIYGVPDRALPDEAEVFGACHRRHGFGGDGLAGLVNIDHGAAGHERREAPRTLPPLVHAEGLAAQHLAIEGEGRLEVLDDDDDVVEPADHLTAGASTWPPHSPPFCAGAPPAGAQRHWSAESFGSLYTLLRRVAAPALPPFCAGAPSAGAQRHWSAESFGSLYTLLRRLESFETVQRGQQLEGLAGGAGVVARLPARRFLRRHRASQHDLTMARAHQLVTAPRHLVGGHVGEDGRGRFVVLVLEPGEAFGTTEDGRELGTLPLPRGGPALLARVLRARLEEKTHGAAGHGDLEVAVLLVAALVESKGDPGVVGRVHRAPGMLR